jgi:DsbC/DsbD-like thiol-disulfide interchange protein
MRGEYTYGRKAASISMLALVLAGGLPTAGLWAQGGAKKSDALVKVSAKADKPDADGKQAIAVTIQIEPGWHIYANPPGLKDLEAVQTTVSFSSKTKPEELKVDYPSGNLVKDAILGNYNVYEDKVTIKATVRRAKGDTSPLEVTLKLQACNEKMCLLPATVKQTVQEPN